MDLNRWPNLVAMFFEQARSKKDSPFLWKKQQGEWNSISWSETANQVRLLALALQEYGLNLGDRVVLVGENSPEWAIADFAIMAAGGITVPTYTTNTSDDHHHILADSEATIAIVSNQKLADPLLKAAERLPALKQIISIEKIVVNRDAGFNIKSWDEALRQGNLSNDRNVLRSDQITQEDTACIIYTSGTGGTPKGVMLSHRSILCNCVGAFHLLLELGLDDEVFLSFLPLSHSYEHSCGLMFPTAIGAQIYYAEGIDKLASNLTEVRPTLMTSVPRLYEMMRLRIIDGVQRAGGLKAKLFMLALDLGTERYEQGGQLKLHKTPTDKLVDILVRKKVKMRFGGRLKAMVSGGAPLNIQVGIFFTALGLRLLQGYGQTEAGPVISCNPSTKIKLDTVGPALHSVDVKIAEDGEILVRGPLLMNGYWKQPNTTQNTIKDGWLHTGDIGELDGDGYITITDRKKDIIVLSGGDNISPQRVEGVLGLEPEIAQAMVVGDGRKHLVALLVPSEQTRELQTNSPDENTLKKTIGDAVARANSTLSVIEQVRGFSVVEDPFTVDNEMLTPTLKNRRHKILQNYAEAIETLY
ncbi:MAG: long-chain fatty acid--CoA ligase [Rhodospirillaceae bacterium]|nr:long-chain fatty acid--CoA ligase [Rhodospirillaceae bacterium]